MPHEDAAPAATDLDRLLVCFRSPAGVSIRDRMYHGITFPACFVGSQAVAWVRREHSYTHNEAMTLGQRWVDLFIVHHVADEHPFKDGRYFYRFYENKRNRARLIRGTGWPPLARSFHPLRSFSAQIRNRRFCRQEATV